MGTQPAVVDLNSTYRKGDRQSISHLLNEPPAPQYPMLQINPIAYSDSPISPSMYSLAAVGRSGSSSSVGTPAMHPEYNIRYPGMHMQQGAKPGYFAATHQPFVSTYYNYASGTPNQGILSQINTGMHPQFLHPHAQLLNNIHTLNLPLHSPTSISNFSSPAPGLMLGLPSPMELGHKPSLQQLRYPFFTSSTSGNGTVPEPKSYLPGVADVTQMQDLIDKTQVRYIQAPPKQMPVQMPSSIIGYGNAIGAVPQNTPYFYGPGVVEGLQPELYTGQCHLNMVGFPYFGQKNRRFRRRYHQIYRKYKCHHPNCTKSYGSLNHLNTHIVTKNHGHRLSKAEFRSLVENEEDYFSARKGRSHSDSACLSPDGSESACSVEEEKKNEEKTEERSASKLPLVSSIVLNVS